MGSWKRYATVAVVCTLLAAAGCSRNSGGALGGNTTATGDKADQDTQKQDTQKQGNQPKKGGQPDSQFTEPQNAVDGKPSADSDRGSASAVAHHSVAQPGAPQGTVGKEGSAAAPAKTASPHR